MRPPNYVYGYPPKPQAGRGVSVPRYRPATVMTARRPYSRTGLNALKARVKVRGLAAIDRRTAAARALLDWRQTLLDDLGGLPTVTAAQLALVEMVARTRLFVDHLDAWLMQRRSLVIARRRAVLPVLRERQQLVDSLARLLGQLGLERRGPKPVELGEYLAARYGRGPGAGAPPAPGAPASGAPTPLQAYPGGPPEPTGAPVGPPSQGAGRDAPNRSGVLG